jgi:hypothetical protein
MKHLIVVSLVMAFLSVLSLSHAKISPCSSRMSSAPPKRMNGLTHVEGVVVSIVKLDDKYVVVVRDGQIYKAVECLGSSKAARLGYRWSCYTVAGTGTWKVQQDGREFNVALLRWDSLLPPKAQ